MEEDFKTGGDARPKLLDLIPNERDWLMVQDAGARRRARKGVGGLDASEEKKLELRLGLPGGEEDKKPAVLSLGFFSKAPEIKKEGSQLHQQEGGLFQLQSRAVAEKKWSHEAHATPGNASGPNTSSQTRASAAPVVGWPPIRSFRKNLASTSAKQSAEHGNEDLETKVNIENGKKGLLVKINMDGVPIGRKVDLKTYDSYEKLSCAVEDLFLCLLEAQKDTSANALLKGEGAKQAFTGLLDGTGEYTLVYEDNEGDRMLVGDVPWEMFVSTVKRLRVLKSSDLSALTLGAICRKRTATEC